MCEYSTADTLNEKHYLLVFFAVVKMFLVINYYLKKEKILAGQKTFLYRWDKETYTHTILSSHTIFFSVVCVYFFLFSKML